MARVIQEPLTSQGKGESPRGSKSPSEVIEIPKMGDR